MPWTIGDVDRHNKGLSDKQKEQWVAVANSALARCLDDGGEQDECEASAIRQANGAVAEAATTEARGQGQGVGGAPQGDGGVEDCVCPECGATAPHERGTPCTEQDCPKCGAKMEPQETEMENMPNVEAKLWEQWASLETLLSQIRGEFERQVGQPEAAKAVAVDVPASYWVRDVLVGHPELGNSVVIEQGGMLYAVPFEMKDDKMEFAAKEDWAPVVQTYTRLSLSQPSETASEVADLAEAGSGYALGLAEGHYQAGGDNGPRAPVEFDLKIITPGAGNKHDNHYYPAEMLRRDAHVFEGVDVFVTDHRENERSERTKVGKIKSIIGFTEDGGPIGRTVVYDPALAEKTRNRALAGELETLHCSILAQGRAKKGEVDGHKYRIVEAIDRADAVDLVSRAGAGGRALSLAESEMGGEPMDQEQPETIEEQEPVQDAPAEEPLEEVTLSEQEPEDEDTPAPATLAAETVRELVEATRLPEPAKARLSEAQYADEDAVQAAVAAEVAYLKEVTGSGRPFAQDGGRAPERKPRSAEEADADWTRILTEVGMPYLAGG